MLELLTCMCGSLCTTVVHNTAQSSSDYLLSYPQDKQQSSDAVYIGKEGDEIQWAGSITVQQLIYFIHQNQSDNRQQRKRR